tara:strand:+ start:237 stop:536 length:300 start_codon:yes stop_codon:yes gene_type:complete
MSLKDTVTALILALDEDQKDASIEGCLPDVFENEKIQVSTKDSYGGEDQGSDYWHIYSFIKDHEEVFVKFYGWYASHYGSEYRGYSFVTPEEKTITIYK